MRLSGTQSGLGGLRLKGYYTKPWKNRNFIFSAELKFLTRNYDRLTGSGGLSFSLGLMLIDPFSLEKYRLVVYGALATIFMGDTDGLLPNVQNGFVVADRVGISWQATKLIQFKLQDEVLSALYDRDLKDMEKPAFQVVTGGRLNFRDNAYLDISVAEDKRASNAAAPVFN